MSVNNCNNEDPDIFFKSVVTHLFKNLEALRELANYQEANTDPDSSLELVLPGFKFAFFQGVNPKGRLVFLVETLRGSAKIFTVNRDGFFEYDTIEKFGSELTKKIIIFLVGALIHEISWEPA